MPRKTIPATGEAVSTVKATGLDAKLLRLEAEFNARCDQWDQASEKTAKLEEKFDRIRAKIREAEDEEERAGDAMAELFFKVMKRRSKSLEGMLAKMRVRKRWNADDEETERTVLNSLMQDLEPIAKIDARRMRTLG